MQIVIEEEAVGAHGGVEGLFSGVTERRMAEIVNQRQRFGEIDVEIERGGYGAGDLRDFDRVGETVAEVVGVAAGEDLGFVFEAAKGAGMDDTITVALEIVAIGMGYFRDAASAGMFYVDRVASGHGKSLALLIADCGSLIFHTDH
jgi:hypothetical protein